MMNRTNSLASLFLLLMAAVLVSSCDEGDINESNIVVDESGKVVKMTGRLSGVNSWDNSYCVAVAAFSNGSQYAVTQRQVPTTTKDGDEVSLVLSNLSDEVNTVELVVTNKLRERIMTLASINLDSYEAGGDTIRMDVGDIRTDLFGCMQYGIFNKACIQCHGGNGKSAAGLNLTEGNSYDMLVNQASAKVDGAYRVKAGDPENSVLRQILNEGGENILHYNHTEVLSSQFKDNLTNTRSLIDMWIKSLPTDSVAQ